MAASRGIARNSLADRSNNCLVALVRKDEPLLAVVHRDSVFGGVEHSFQTPMPVGELRPDGRDLPFHVPRSTWRRATA